MQLQKINGGKIDAWL